jgi:hypothetical protein
MIETRQLDRGIVHAASLLCCGLVLVSVGQPLFTDDLWWHLGLGAAYAEAGPRLDHDPLLFTASGPPPPAAWLADLGLHAAVETLGFQGLRILHVLMVAGLLGLVWRLARRASGSASLASGATALFAVLCAYRLFQLRPHLFTIAAALLLYGLVLEGRRPASWPRIAAAAGLLGLWANLHPGFPLGPALLAASLGALLATAPLLPRDRRRDRLLRARALAIALGLGLVATIANPAGLDAWRLAVASGGDMTAQVALQVVDEWRPTQPLTLPAANLPPSPLSWGLVWVLSLGTFAASVQAVRSWRRRAERDVDPVAVALAVVSAAAMLAAVRFVWLGVFPILLLLAATRSHRPATRRGRLLTTALTTLLIPGFVVLGDWGMISKGVSSTWRTYTPAYRPSKYHAHAIWLLRDARVEGNLYTRYPSGGFSGYWLAPRMRTATNGSLNVPDDAMLASLLIRERKGSLEHPFLELLDEQEIDVFLGTGLPIAGRPNRPPSYTTTHLEHEPGWIPIFRNLESALYLRRNARNADNLDRLATWYTEAGVPFDRDAGFDPDRALREAPEWSIEHGLIPRGFPTISARTHAAEERKRIAALDTLAALQATLGLYDAALATDATLLADAPDRTPALRRRLWAELHRREGPRAEHVRQAARRLAPTATPPTPDARLLAAARAFLERGSLPPHVLINVPLLTRAEANRLLAGVEPPEVRTRTASE